MSCAVLAVAEEPGALGLLLLDASVKGTALLLLAGLVTLLMRRDSAAARHLVWLLALGGLPLIPVLSAVLPQWNVLPGWVTFAGEPAPVPLSVPSTGAATNISSAEPVLVSQSSAGDRVPADGAPTEVPRMTMETTDTGNADPAMPRADDPEAAPALAQPATPVRPVMWLLWLWAAGCGVLLLRLVAARLLFVLRERRAQRLSEWPRGDEIRAGADPVISAFETSCRRLQVRRRVRLLMHGDNTIPVVWGLARSRLLLPDEARGWSSAQLGSVLLHEVAHIRRCDTVAQFIAQLACCCYWFNPLVWVASWRLQTERERASDDLVLASGVRASDYAGHLLDVATRASSSSWTHACGLAMARSSSLERRLQAVLHAGHNRRTVTRALMIAALLCVIAISVPLSMLRAGDTDVPRSAGSSGPAEEAFTASGGTPETQQARALPAGVEDRLQWGEPVKGLRAALSRVPALHTPVGPVRDFDLVIQNVSEQAVRFVASADVPNPRTLYVREDGSTLMGLSTKDPSEVDVTLQPRQAVVVRMYPIERMDIASLFTVAKRTFYARMEIASGPAGVWTGKLATAETTVAQASGQRQPEEPSARALFHTWQSNARLNGKIPGGALRSLERAGSNFVKYNPTDERAPRLTEWLKGVDTSRDWTPDEAVALLDAVTDIYPKLPQWAQDLPRFELSDVIRAGTALPKSLENAPWGAPASNGLRAAWFLDPSAASHHLNTPLKSRLLYHNTGSEAIVFRLLTWNQSSAHKARDELGQDIQIIATSWTTIPQIVVCRLQPGEYAEVVGAGIGVGKNLDQEDWRGTRVGAWIHAEAGDEVTFTPAPISADGRDGRVRPTTQLPWWTQYISDRLHRDAPVPPEAAERKRLLERAMQDLFGSSASEEEIQAFVADRAPNALDALAERLAQRAGTVSFSGMLTSGPTKFRVLPVDPVAATRPRTAGGPGRYTLGENIRLVISRRGSINEAAIRFFAPPDAAPAPDPHEVLLPNGTGTWAIAWERNASVLWIAEKGIIRRCDFTDTKNVRETRMEPSTLADLPERVRPLLRSVFQSVSGAPPTTAKP